MVKMELPIVVHDLTTRNHFVAIIKLRWHQILQPYTPNHQRVVGLIQVLCGFHYCVKVMTPQTYFPPKRAHKGLT